jgi:hypothetical protein
MHSLHQTVDLASTPFSGIAMSHCAMAAEERLIRQRNFALVCKRRGLGPKDLVSLFRDHGGGSYSLWSDLLNPGSNKPFGEKIARRIEAGLGLPRGFLDEPKTAAEVAGAESGVRGRSAVVMFNARYSPAGLSLAELFDSIPDDDVKAQLYSEVSTMLTSAVGRLPTTPEQSGPDGGTRGRQPAGRKTPPGKRQVDS